MKEALKRIKADVILSAVLSMALGVVLFVWSDQTINVICMVFACGLVVMGAVNLARFFTDRVMNTFSGILGLVLVLVGVWLFARPSYIAVIVPIVIGVSLLCTGWEISGWHGRRSRTDMRSGGVRCYLVS